MSVLIINTSSLLKLTPRSISASLNQPQIWTSCTNRNKITLSNTQYLMMKHVNEQFDHFLYLIQKKLLALGSEAHLMWHNSDPSMVDGHIERNFKLIQILDAYQEI